MSDRFPLIVNEVSRKIEELVAGDSLELTNNGIVISGDRGSGKYLTSDGTNVLWGNPGDVYLTQTQTLTNKTLLSSVISGASNTITNIPNAALSNSSITINGSAIALGGTVVTPNDNTTYTVSAVDGLSATQKIIRLTAGGSGSGNDDVTLAVGSPASVPAGSQPLVLELDRQGDIITLAGTSVDNNTVTTLQSAVGGTPQTGAITIAATGSSTVSQAGTTITIDSSYVDTVTRVRATAGQVYSSGDFTFLASGATSIAQSVDGNGDPTIEYSSTDTVTRLRGTTIGSYTSGDITLTGGTNVTVSQVGSTLEISSIDTNTVTRLASGANLVSAGDFKFTGSGATTITQTTAGGVTTFEISSVNSDTGATLTASGGLLLSGTDFQLKNYANFTGNTVVKWDSGNNQLANSLITDNGSTVTIGGDLIVTGTQTILETQTLIVEDNQIELRKGTNLTGADGGIQLNRATDAAGNVSSYQAFQWYESGGYWRSFDGSIEHRMVSENETQTLTNKTLTSPTLTSPTLGAATATSINGLIVTSTASSTLTVDPAKTLEVQRSLLLTTDDVNNSVTVNFRNGGNIAYRSDTLAAFASTTSTQLRGLISDTTGTGRLVFQDGPTILTAINTGSASFNLVNSTATSINLGGAAQTITIGAAGGTTTFDQSVVVNEDLTVGAAISDSITFNGTLNLELADLTLYGGSAAPFYVGRGGGSVTSNVRAGHNALLNNSSGSQNTAIGFEALYTNNSGASNTAIGNRALRANGVGRNNVAIGKDCLLVNLDGEQNIGIGNNSLASNNAGDANVCIGHYAGFAALGTGNVLIGPADNENAADATYAPPNIGGDRQLVIGSGTNAWIRGDNQFKVTVPSDLTVGGDTTIQGNLVIQGTTTTIESNTISVDDKNLELAAVANVTFTAVCADGSNQITGITPTAGIIPGMRLNSVTGGIDLGANCEIVSLNGNSATLSTSVTGSGTATIDGTGPSDTAANGGGLILKGDTDKTILYDNTRTDKYWTFSENLEIAFGKKFVIGNQLALSASTLGATVVNSSLTSVGTLTNLTVDGFVTIGGVVTEKVFNNYSTALTPASGVLTINLAGANTFCGTPAATAINTWDFTGVGLSNGQSKTITLILTANTAAIYGDACNVDSVAISNGVEWSGGSPPVPTANTDILTFVIVKDNAGITKVFGQGNTDFS